MDPSDDKIDIDLDATDEVAAESDEDDNFEHDIEAELDLAYEAGYCGDHSDNDDEPEIWDEEGNDIEVAPHKQGQVNLAARNNAITYGDAPSHRQAHGNVMLEPHYIAMLQEFNTHSYQDEGLKEQLESLSREAQALATGGQQHGQQLMHLLSEPSQQDHEIASYTDHSRREYESLIAQLRQERDSLAIEKAKLLEEKKALTNRVRISLLDESVQEELEDLRFQIHGKGGYEEQAEDMKKIIYDFEENYVPKNAHTSSPTLDTEFVRPHLDQQVGSIISPDGLATRQYSNCQNCGDLQKRFASLYHESSLDSARHNEATQQNHVDIQELKNEIIFYTNEVTKSEQTRVAQLQQIKDDAAKIAQLELENVEHHSHYEAELSQHLKEIERRNELEKELRAAIDLYKQRSETSQVSAVLLKEKDDKIAKLRNLFEFQETSLKEENSELKKKDVIIRKLREESIETKDKIQSSWSQESSKLQAELAELRKKSAVAQNSSSTNDDQLRGQLTSAQQEIDEQKRIIDLLKDQKLAAIAERDTLTVTATKATDDLEQQKKTIENLWQHVKNTDKKYDDLAEQLKSSLDSEKHLEEELYRVTSEFNVVKGHLSDSHARYSEASARIKELEEAGNTTEISEPKVRIADLEARNLKAVGIIDELKAKQERLESQLLKEKDIVRVLQGRIGAHNKQKHQLEDQIVALGGTVDNHLLGTPVRMQSPSTGSSAPQIKEVESVLDQELDNLRTRNGDLQQRVAELMANLSRSTAEVRHFREQNGALQHRVDELTSQAFTSGESINCLQYDLESRTDHNVRLQELGVTLRRRDEQIHRLTNELGETRITVADIEARNKELTQQIKSNPSQLLEATEGSATSLLDNKRPRPPEASNEEQPTPKRAKVAKKAKVIREKKGPASRKSRTPKKAATPALESRGEDAAPATVEPEPEGPWIRPARATRNPAPKYNDTYTATRREKKNKGDTKAKGPRKQSVIRDPNYMSPALGESEDDSEADDT